MNNDHCPPEKSKPKFRLLIINSSGNSTKTVSGTFIRNRMQDPKYYIVGYKDERINDFERVLQADRISELHDTMMVRESAIVEIEVSGYERTINYMRDMKGCNRDYDAVLVPVINSSFKLIEDSIRTIDDLISVGVSPDKIRVLFNREPNSIESFDRLTDKLDELEITYDLETQITHHLGYEKLKELKIEYDDITESTLDAAEEKLVKLRSEEQPREESETIALQKKLLKLVSVQRAVLASKQQHNEIFNKLFSDLIST